MKESFWTKSIFFSNREPPQLCCAIWWYAVASACKRDFQLIPSKEITLVIFQKKMDLMKKNKVFQLHCELLQICYAPIWVFEQISNDFQTVNRRNFAMRYNGTQQFRRAKVIFRGQLIPLKKYLLVICSGTL